MKNSKALLMLSMAAMMNPEVNEITEQGNVGNSKRKNPKPIKEPTPFNQQEGIKKMISDYKLIKEGKSEKGRLKQNRIVEKIESYLEKGFLTNEDLKN